MERQRALKSYHGLAYQSRLKIPHSAGRRFLVPQAPQRIPLISGGPSAVSWGKPDSNGPALPSSAVRAPQGDPKVVRGNGMGAQDRATRFLRQSHAYQPAR
jgi:hypothetical protein